jgi:hypothetical protein
MSAQKCVCLCDLPNLPQTVLKILLQAMSVLVTSVSVVARCAAQVLTKVITFVTFPYYLRDVHLARV